MDPLATPAVDVPTTVEQAARYRTVALFVERAAAVDLGFSLTDDNASDIAAICARLDGLPIATELAAARIKVLAPGELLTRLEQRLPVLKGGARDLPARQQTLRDTIAWSHDLLPPDQQAAFRRLGVFVGGWTLKAAERVAGDPDGDEVVDHLASLINNGLVRREETSDASRFRLLETVRDYALERLAATGEVQSTRAAHARYFHGLGQRAEGELHGPRMRWWHSLLETEHPNLRAALHWFGSTGETERELQLAIALAPFWYHRAHQREGADWLEDAVRRSGGADALLRADALAWVSHLTNSSRVERSRAAARASRVLAEDAGDPVAIAHALYAQSVAEGWFGGDLSGGIAVAERAVSLHDREGGRPPWFRGHLIGDLGAMLILAGERERGIALVEDAVAYHLGESQLWGAGLKLCELGLAAHQVGEARRATEQYRAGLELIWGVRDPTNVYHGMTGISGLAADMGHHETTARLLGAVAGIEERSGASVHPPFRPIQEAARSSAKRKLGAAYDLAFAAGRSLPLELAVAEALRIADEFTAHQNRDEPR